jgi:hypothetical protein
MGPVNVHSSLRTPLFAGSVESDICASAHFLVAVPVVGRAAVGAYHDVIIGGKSFAASGAVFAFIFHTIPPFLQLI